MQAFWLLSAGRQPGFGLPGPITASDILAVSNFYEPDDQLRFLRVIRALDALLLKHAADEQERERLSKAKK